MEIVVLLIFVLAAVAVLSLFGRLSDSAKKPRSTKQRAAFKARYGLNAQQSISEFEQKMLVGMSRERNEVWVAAFCSGS